MSTETKEEKNHPLLDKLLEAAENMRALLQEAVDARQFVVASKLDCAGYEIRSAIGCWNYCVPPTTSPAAQ